MEYESSKQKEEPLILSNQVLDELRDPVNENAIEDDLLQNDDLENEYNYEAKDGNINSAVLEMQKAIFREKESPEVLQYEKELVTNLDKYVNSQKIVVSGMKVTAKDQIFLDAYKLEIERMLYMLKSYLRIRLAKIEKHCLHIIKNDKAELLSDEEFTYAFKFFTLK